MKNVMSNNQDQRQEEQPLSASITITLSMTIIRTIGTFPARTFLDKAETLLSKTGKIFSYPVGLIAAGCAGDRINQSSPPSISRQPRKIYCNILRPPP